MSRWLDWPDPWRRSVKVASPERAVVAGYRTALIGRWRLGYPPHFGPLKSGYDEHFGPLSGGVSYCKHRDRGGRTDLEENGEPANFEGPLSPQEKFGNECA